MPAGGFVQTIYLDHGRGSPLPAACECRGCGPAQPQPVAHDPITGVPYASWEWAGASFPGEPGFSANDDQIEEGYIRLSAGRYIKCPVVCRADVLKLPKLPPAAPQTRDLLKANVLHRLIERGKAEQSQGQFLKRNVEWPTCQAIGLVWLEYLAVWGDKALDPYINRKRNRPAKSKL